MPDKLTFPTVQLLGYSRKSTGGVAQFSSSITAQIEKAMQWNDIPECATGASLEGELASSLVMLTPKDKELEKHSVDLDCTKVCSFELVRLELEGKKGKGYRQELRFKVHFNDVKGGRKLEEYLLTCGKGQLVVSYTKQPVQETIPGTEDEDKQEKLSVQ